jgi:hypothetical protein
MTCQFCYSDTHDDIEPYTAIVHHSTKRNPRLTLKEYSKLINVLQVEHGAVPEQYVT